MDVSHPHNVIEFGVPVFVANLPPSAALVTARGGTGNIATNELICEQQDEVQRNTYIP